MQGKRLKKNRPQRNEFLFWAVLILLIAIAAYCAYRLADYYLADRRSRQVAERASRSVIVTQTPGLDKDSTRQQIQVDFDELREMNEDVVAWLYSPDTVINYPVVQGNDNDEYLHLLPDRTWNANGSLFLDYRCTFDFSDDVSIIYGHHMKTGAMFGSLVQYKEQSYYKEHPCFYLITPEQKYKVELFAGRVIRADSEIYQGNVSKAFLQECIDRSTFITPIETVPEGPVLVLSTCTYEFQNARYIVLGSLIPME